MALFDVGSLPPWMIQRESPTDALAKGIQAGSQIAHNLLAARNFALQQQESIVRQQNDLRIREGLIKFGTYMGGVTNWDDPKAEAGAWAVGKEAPWIMNTPAFREGIQNFKTARMASDEQKSREKISAEIVKSRELASKEAATLRKTVSDDALTARLEARPGSMSSVIGKLDPEYQAAFNQLFPDYQTGKALAPDVEAKAWKVLRQFGELTTENEAEREKVKAGVKQGPESPIGKLYADRDAAVAAGKPESVIKSFDAAIQEAVTNKGKSIYLGMDDQGRPIFQMTEGGAAAPTVATQSKVQQDLLQWGVNYDLLNDIKTELRPGDVGVLGVAGEYALDRLAAQLGGAGFDAKRATNREKLRVSIQGLARVISTDPKFSEADRKRAEAAQASVGVFESYPRAIEVIKTLQDIFSERAKMYAPGAGMSVPTWALSPDEIKAQFQAKKLTKEQAAAAMRKYHPNYQGLQ